jgi:pimeloyl-ACP methyl ester carboxylesterase
MIYPNFAIPQSQLFRGVDMAKLNNNFIITTRDVDSKGRLGNEPGDTRFLKVPKGLRKYDVSHQVKDPNKWRLAVRAAADGVEDEITGTTGDVLVFVHGYNNDMNAITWRTEVLQTTLEQQGWEGIVIAFDWPSNNSTLNYLEDRADAAAVADRMVSDAIGLLVTAQSDQENPCKLNVHLLGHSTGAYVITEAFSQAQKHGKLYKSDWRVAQVALIGADIAAESLRASSEWSRPLFDRCVRLTNYSNQFDSVLGVSNAKRLGTSPRVGRVGLPQDAYTKAVNVNCSSYFSTKDPKKSEFNGTFNHSWHIGDPVFALDLAMTLEADIDRGALPTRTAGAHGLELKTGQRPAFQRSWSADSPAKAKRIG